jgi:hypothetical protein
MCPEIACSARPLVRYAASLTIFNSVSFASAPQQQTTVLGRYNIINTNTSYPLPNGITNYETAELVYGNPPGNNGQNPNIEYPDYEDVNRHLSTRKNMTLVFLWNRYKKKCEETGRRYYQYRQFCEHYSE